MDYQEFFSKYNYNRRTDVESHTRFGLIYRAVETDRDNKVYLRIMHVDDDRQAPTLEQEVEFVNALPDNPYIQRYTRSYRFEESTGQIDCAVMDFYDIGNLTTLLKNWKLDSGERSGLCGKILETVKFLRDNGVKMGPFTPETIYVSETDGQLIPHLTDLSGFDTDNTGYEEQVKTMLAVDEAEETAEEPEHTRKWLYLMGVLLTWVAIFALIFVLHRSRNNKDEEVAEAADSAKVEKVIYPADEFAKEEAAHADSVEKARADSIAAFKADSAAYVKKMAGKVMRPKPEKKVENPVEPPVESSAEENAAESPDETPAVPVETLEVTE